MNTNAPLSKLLNDINRHFLHFRQGKYTTRQTEKRLLHQIAHDMLALSINLTHFTQLNQANLSRLIDYWQQKGNQNNTLYNKLKALDKHYNIPAIKTVMLDKTITPMHHTKKAVLIPAVCPDMLLNGIKNDALRYLLQGQWLFGLTVNEIMHLHPGMLCQGKMTLLNRYAFNGRTRYIPIITAAQQAWVTNGDVFINKLKSQGLPATWQRRQRALLASYYLPSAYFRYHYIVNRYYALLSQYHCIKPAQYRTVLAQLRMESGYCRNTSIQGMIQCLSNSYVTPNIVCTG